MRFIALIVPKRVLNTGFWIAWFQGWVVTIQAIFPVDIDELNYMTSSLLVQCWWFNGIIKYDAVNPPMPCALLRVSFMFSKPNSSGLEGVPFVSGNLSPAIQLFTPVKSHVLSRYLTESNTGIIFPPKLKTIEIWRHHDEKRLETNKWRPRCWVWPFQGVRQRVSSEVTTKPSWSFEIFRRLGQWIHGVLG